MHWPVLLFYPEASMQHDAIEDVHEEDTFREHLDVMFGPEAPGLEWDAEGAYGRNRLEVYYLSHGATGMGRDALAEALHGGWPAVVEEGPNRYAGEGLFW